MIELKFKRIYLTIILFTLALISIPFIIFNEPMFTGEFASVKYLMFELSPIIIALLLDNILGIIFFKELKYWKGLN